MKRIQGAFWLAVLLGVVIWIVGWFFEPQWWFSLRYNVPYEQVTLNKKPHDCEYETAPLGNKNCHYEKEISAVRVGTSTDHRPIWSADDGKTWNWNDGPDPVKPYVLITWRKVED